jgi:hypothetical protein
MSPPAPPWPFVSIGFARSRAKLVFGLCRERKSTGIWYCIFHQGSYTPRIGLRVNLSGVQRTKSRRSNNEQKGWRK